MADKDEPGGGGPIKGAIDERNDILDYILCLRRIFTGGISHMLLPCGLFQKRFIGFGFLPFDRAYRHLSLRKEVIHGDNKNWI